MDNDGGNDTREEPRPALPVQGLGPIDYRTPEVVQRWVKLGDYSALESELVRNKLENEGILCIVSGQAVSELGFGTVLGRARVEVRADQFEMAREALKRPAVVDEEDDEENYVEEDWRCPKCHRKNVGLLPLKPWELGVCIVTLALAFPFLPRRCVCQDCGHRWRR